MKPAHATRTPYFALEDGDFDEQFDKLAANDPRRALDIAHAMAFGNDALERYLYPRLVHCPPPVGNTALKYLGLSYLRSSERAPLHFDDCYSRKAIECFWTLEARRPTDIVPLELCLEALLDRFLMTCIGADLETWKMRDRPLPQGDRIDSTTLNAILQHYGRELEMAANPIEPLCLQRLLEIVRDATGRLIVTQQLAPALRNYITRHEGDSAELDIWRKCLGLAERVEGTDAALH